MPKAVRRAGAGVVEWARAAMFVPMERLLPVDRSTWCFCTWGTYPHTLDNPRAVFERVKDDPSIRKVVLTRGGVAPVRPVEGANVHIVDAGSPRGMYWMARAAVVVIGYSLRNMCSYSRFLTAKHRIVQLSHGVALRRICRMAPGEDWWARETPRYAATLCSSERDREIMAQAYAPVPAERVWLTGLPRNDFIVEPEERLPADYRRMLEGLRREVAGRRLVLYAPTWRRAGRTHYAFTAGETAALEELLAAHGAVLGIRGHSNVREHAAYTREYGSGAFIQVNELPDVAMALRVADVLVTDYSSIYIDFLLLDRPVIHFVYDRAEYQGERGFLYDLDEAFGGPAPETFAELLVHLEQALARPALHAERRAHANALFHAHPDDSAQAVADRIRALAGAAPQPDAERVPATAPAATAA
ncbi:MAG TPA: CDP-glycerol glycerophosphotransferase family protein [Longimicrobium sp.]